ncbi:hypothetical protein [Jeotgalibacillus terrae]|uniref:Uncharacterized protein n=1 Tax=Jeotgalibacillus terrae TaxID=587735 RepID=A0ABW5ZKM5_9BACL|nr:hypothetical protein [Jeotgalibacillus terrae]MBM7578224.1 hypothetical protein [Jeotgalibacillus terrae]
MKKNNFFDWTVYLQEELTAVIDIPQKKMVILEKAIELNGLLWIDDEDNLQIKPTWDCVISINHQNRSITIQQTEKVFNIE